MPRTEAEILEARLARMRALIDSLEAECSHSKTQHERFLSLKRELAAVKERLKPVDTQ
jgi:hypothetical protein